MTVYTIHEAKTHFSKLIRQVMAGEEIIIANRNTPVAKLVGFQEAKPKRRIGGGDGIVLYMSDDFDEPLEDFSEYM